jgi:glyoxylase-like metal-dependent hydrolase (beta-lactamase superfamily II)
MSTTRKNLSIIAGALGALVVVSAAYFAPYVYAEYDAVVGQEPLIGPKPVVPVAGRWVDDYFVVETIDSSTFAIGEPRYYQGNYSYLILGTQRAVLFDAGTGTRNIVPIVRSLTTLPVTVIPSHLHYDHVGALGRFDSTALLDAPSLRARIRDSKLTLGRYEFLGFHDALARPTFRVDEWWAPDSVVDLGHRQLRVLSTPGHTPTSVSLYDEERHQLFAGDFIYPGQLYAFLPGASRSAYLETTRRLLSRIDPTTRIFTAHMADLPAPVAAPVLSVTDLKALERTLGAIDSGSLKSTGFYPRVFPVRGIVTFATGLPWNNR